jgi:hypothetical protein
MLPGILTTALEIIIILDICGAVVYFALSGLAKRKESEGEATPYPLQGMYSSQLQPVMPGGISSPSYPLATYPCGADVSIYAGEPTQDEPQKGFNVTAGLMQRLTALKSRLTYSPNSRNEAKPAQDEDQRKLGQILDSFREES